MLYLFSGCPRKGSVSHWTRKLAAKWHIKVQIDMVDIKVKPHLDLTRSSVQQSLLNKVESGYYVAIIMSPPCSTFTRATFSNRKGPRPVRNFVHLRGMPRLTWTERKKADWGNVMTDFTYEICKAVRKSYTLVIFENPEDLGAIKQGHWEGYRPASMWQWPAFSDLVSSGDFKTCAFYQQDFGTEYLKPTRLLLRNVSLNDEQFKEGTPSFDAQGFYLGPLTKRSAKFALIGHKGGHFTTTGIEQWPSKFCKWVAEQIIQFWNTRPSMNACGGGRTDTDGESPKVEYEVTEPEGWKIHGGEGEARICESPGKKRMFHDGCGLASPGRWDLEKRRWNKDSFWNSLRKDSMEAVLEHCGGQTNLDRMCFEMAAKGEAGCTLMKDEVLKQKLVDI